MLVFLKPDVIDITGSERSGRWIAKGWLQDPDAAIVFWE